MPREARNPFEPRLSERLGAQQVRERELKNAFRARQGLPELVEPVAPEKPLDIASLIRWIEAAPRALNLGDMVAPVGRMVFGRDVFKTMAVAAACKCPACRRGRGEVIADAPEARPGQDLVVFQDLSVEANRSDWHKVFKDPYAFAKALSKRGYRKLGGGAFSWVYGKPGSDRVVKVAHEARDDAWPAFAAWCHENPSRYLPKVYSFKRHGSFYVAVMERMDQTVWEHGSAETTRLAKTFASVVRYGEREADVDTYAIRCAFPGALETFERLHERFNDRHERELRWDLHLNNWMVAPDGRVVLTDPLCATTRGSCDQASSIRRIKSQAPVTRVAA